MSKNVKLDIPIEDLPFEAGKGFFATVEDGIAHIFVTVKSSGKSPKSESVKSSKTWAERAGELTTSIDLQTITDEAKVDDRLSIILEKYAPELLN